MKIITHPLPGTLKYLDSRCHATTVRFAGFGFISKFICILEISMMKYQLNILKRKNLRLLRNGNNQFLIPEFFYLKY
jgi:hypothetical protein